MKRLMLGNEAVARGLYEAGCAFVSSYPGTPSTEITEAAAKYPEIYAEWAPNEKVAMEAAFGASLAGKRSFCGMKHVGLNVAADPLFTIAYTGVNAGMIIGVADDAGMHSSQNEQDSRHYAMAAKLPMLEPSDSAEALEFTKLAYALSEEFDTAVLLKMCTRVSHSQSVVDTGERADIPQKPYEKNGAKYIMMPGNAKRRHPVVEERTRRLVEWAETAPVNRVEEGRDHKLGIITSSTSYQYVKEVCGDTYPVLKLGMIWPLPEKLILDFAASVDALTVVEELDGFIEAHCRSLGLSPTGKDVFPAIDEFNQNLVAAKLGQPATVGPKLEEAIPARPPVMCAGCPHRGLFYTLAKNKLTVLGDIGCYTLGAVAPLSAIDTTICMGASVSGLHGFNKAGGGQGEGKTVAVIGDSTFIHSGVTGLINVAYNPGQLHHRHDRPPAEPHHRLQPEGGPLHQDRPGDPVPGRGHPPGPGRGPLRSGGVRRGGEGGAGGGGALRHHLPPALRPAEIRQAPRPHRLRSRQVRGLQVLHADRLPRHQHRGRQGSDRQHPLRGLRRLPAAVQVRRIRLYFFLKEKVGKKNFTFGTDPTF